MFSALDSRAPVMYQCSVEGAKVDRLHCTLMSIGDTVSAVLPRDAILTRYMLSSCVRLSVSLSVTGWCSCSIETNARINKLFWHGSYLRPNF